MLNPTTATPTVKPALKSTIKTKQSAASQRSLVPVQIVKTEPYTVAADTFNKVTLLNVSGRSIAYLGIFVQENFTGWRPVNFFRDYRAALAPNQEVTIDNIDPKQPFIVGVVVYTDYSGDGDPSAVAREVETLKGFVAAARHYKKLLVSLKQQRHSVEAAFQQVMEDVDKEKRVKRKTDRGQNYGFMQLTFYIERLLVLNNDRQQVLRRMDFWR